MPVTSSGRFLLKLTLMFFAIAVPLVMLPWPIKMIIDHVVLGTPIEEATGYPPIWHPFLDALAGSGPLEVLAAVMVVLALFVLLIGGYAQGDNARDETEGNLEEGHDTATKVENSLHGAHSYVGGIYGYIDFKINTRLTQSVNHYFRARLFERIKALPMTTLEEQRIGDSVYRVMYDAPAINQGFYGTWYAIVMAIAVMFMAIGTFMSAYPDSPGFILLLACVFPCIFLPLRGLLAHGATPGTGVAGGGRRYHEHHRGGHGQHPRGAELRGQPQGEGAVRRR